MIPEIKITEEKLLLGNSMLMDLSHSQIGELWKNFIPKSHKLTQKKSTDLFSVSVYDEVYFKNFNPKNTFQKWAAVEVDSLSDINVGLESLIIPKGLYAVFYYKGLNTDTSIFQYIFGTWLPSSEYELDQRPHFEVLGKNYKNNDPESEEEIWIPIKIK
ncbi:MAG: GyrI-like domain-containing protein [Cytophagales bacterium]